MAHWARQTEREIAATSQVSRCGSDLLGDLRQIFVRSCFVLQRRQASRQGIEDARPAAVVSVQRFDSVLRPGPHFHALFVDGVFTEPPGAGRAVFHPLPPPSDADLARVAARIFRRTLALQRERGLAGECGQGPLLDDELTAVIRGAGCGSPTRPDL
jgi:hypothetical protein